MEQNIVIYPKDERISLEQYNREIEEAEKRMDVGQYISQEDIEEDAKKW